LCELQTTIGQLINKEEFMTTENQELKLLTKTIITNKPNSFLPKKKLTKSSSLKPQASIKRSQGLKLKSSKGKA